MSNKIDDLLDEFDNAAYLGSNLDVEIAKGKLRGHFSVLESRAERAEQELSLVKRQLTECEVDCSKLEADRDDWRDRARRWKRIAKAMYHRTGMYCDLYNASEEKLEALQDKYDWGVLQSEDDDCYWRSKLEKANNRAAVWKRAAKNYRIECIKRGAFRWKGLAKHFRRRLRNVESKYDKLNTCCHCQCLLIVDEFAYCEDCGPPDFDCMNEKCDHCVEHNGRCPEDKDDVW